MRLTSRINKKGFTMAELMLVVGLMVLLFALIVPGVIRLRRELYQQELDSKAQTIYIAAQNQFIKLRSSGNSDGYAGLPGNPNKVYPLINEPSDRSVEIDDLGEAVEMPKLYYLSSKDAEAEGSAASLVMKELTADSELLGNAWVIEFIPQSGSVYSVFYSEDLDLSDYYTNWDHYDELRYRENRLKDGAHVGYYGGDSVGSSSTAVLQPSISIINAETLTATFQCTRPSISPVGEDLVFHIVVSDNEGHSYSMDYTYGGSNYRLERDGRSYHTTITFDDLASAATRFNALFGSESGHGSNCLVPGTELTVSLTVRSPNKQIEPRTVVAVTNSLFANESNSFADGSGHNDTAVIEYGRHLQNLDVLYDEQRSIYNNVNVVNAVQSKSVNFRESVGQNDWYSVYCGADNSYFNGKDASGNAKFKPISLGSNFLLFDGRNNDSGKTLLGRSLDSVDDNCTIGGLNVQTSGDAGLFADLSGNRDLTFRNISVTGASVKGSANSGGLIGSIVNSAVEIENCRVYLSRTDGDINNKTQNDVWISGRNAGGLIGVISGNTDLGLIDSFASSVIRGTETSGGLIGNCDARTYIDRCYADNYLHGRDVGGLVGLTGVGSHIYIADAYSAGFLYPTESGAGIVNGSADGISRSYTICSMSDETVTYYSTVAAFAGVSPNAVYYFKPASVSENNIHGTYDIGAITCSQLTELLAGRDENMFTAVSSTNTYPYNLMGQTLSTYSYPRLIVNDHYGDWEAEFQTGSLVYYEKYDIDGATSYGFYGGNVTSTLVNKGNVVGDGYGIVYRASDSHPDSVSMTVNGTSLSVDLSGGHYTVIGKDGLEYHVFPLPVSLINAEDPPSGFYQKVVIGSGEDGESDDDLRVYFYNPYFAKTVKSAPNDTVDSIELTEDEQVSIRSARQLYNLSLHHDVYADELDGRDITFLQERNISYSAYDWNGFYRAGVRMVDRQEPIGKGERHFKSNYNGQSYYISDVSFISASGSNVGLIGYNEGNLQNIVIRTDYIADADKQYIVQRTEDIGMNSRVSMGILAGYNGRTGVINNCAVAGYYIAGSDGTIHAYSNSRLYVGGLVGTNEGRIQNSAADCPFIRLSTLNAVVYMGGFTGENRGGGVIYNCYSIGHLDVAYSRGGSVSLSGFAGSNNGSISNSYCAVSLVSSGETSVTYAFSPKGGAMSGNYYLDRGTYTYINKLHPYSSETSRTAGESKTRNELIALRGRARVDSAHSFNYPNTKSEDEAYPYRGVVRDRSGAFVHYGDWQDDAVLGTLGVFYWEHEEHGANDGYHLTYIGTDEGLSDIGTTLCNSHDDGGVITEYGYGFYVKEGQEDQVSVEIENLVWSGKDKVNVRARNDLHTQMHDYVFYPFTTKIASTGDYIRLAGGQHDRDGKITLTFHGSGSAASYEYYISPFFGNSIRSANAGKLVTNDGDVTDFSKELGGEKNVYEVRSAQQLQFINWNYATKTNTDLVTKENRMDFPYLQYATIVEMGVQGDDLARVYEHRPVRYWQQTHDVDGGNVDDFRPIAGAATSNPNEDSYVNYLYAWFGSSYDGDNYKIQNLNVVSDSFTVGVFGVTVGANIGDIILYGDGETRVERNTGLGDGIVGVTPGAYAVGGLIGIAYDYNLAKSTSVISNCAIAGYKIIDSSTNKQRKGEANVGGLIGVANVRLEKCSSVVDIEINCLHPNGHAQYGSYIRVGGLSGAALFTVTDCYTGGNISVGRETIDELPLELNTKTMRADRENCAHIYVSGVTGSAFTSNFSNFTGNTSTNPDGKPTFTNCYTYMNLPNLEGTIKGVTLIAGPADRYSRATRITINNCYYLDSVRSRLSFTTPEYYLTNRAKDEPLTEEEFQLMLDGDLTANNRIVYQNNATEVNPPDGLATSVTFAELSETGGEETESMAELMGKNWGWVTVTEPGGANIDGKYSFSSNPAQSGKNYPFPTVITQKDLTFGGTVHVHYGEWPIDGVYWRDGLATMNIFDNMQPADDSGKCWSEKVFYLYDAKGLLEGTEPTVDDFSVSPSNLAAVTSVSRSDSDPNVIEVRVRALDEGAVTVTEKVSGMGASFILDITSELEIVTDPVSVENYMNRTSTMILRAVSPSGNDFSDRGTWAIIEDNRISIEADPESSNVLTVTHYEPCSFSLETTFVYVYNGKEYSYTGFSPITTYGYIGLGAIPELNNGVAAYSAAARQPSGSVTGAHTTYSVDVPALPEGVEGEFFIYESVTDNTLYKLSITGLTLSYTMNGVPYYSEFSVDSDGYAHPRNGNIDEGDFEIRLGDAYEMIADSNYAYIVGRIRYTGSGSDAPRVTLHITLTHADDFSDSDGTQAYTNYSFSVSIRTHNRIATFLPNGGTGITDSVRTSDGHVTMPECRFVKPGYEFAGWLYDGPDGAQILQPGDVVFITQNERFVAQWAPISYTVRFNPGFDTDQAMEPQPFVYDEAQALNENTFTREGFAFLGWSDEYDGDVVYQDNEAVSNLTYEKDGVVTLYAVWAARMNLTLDLNYDEAPDRYLVFETLKERTTELDGYAMPIRFGYKLTGWYTAPQGGVKVLNPDASIANSIYGYTGVSVFDLNQDRTLYAHWEFVRFTLVANGTSTEYQVLSFADDYAVPEKTNYYLDGWYSADEGGGRVRVLESDGSPAAETVEGYYENGMIADGVVLYARWIKNPVRSGFDPATVSGRKWMDAVQVDWDSGEYLEVEMTLDTSANPTKLQNIISIGDNETNTTNWKTGGSVNVLHVYYPDSAITEKSIMIHEMRDGNTGGSKYDLAATGRVKFILKRSYDEEGAPVGELFIYSYETDVMEKVQFTNSKWETNFNLILKELVTNNGADPETGRGFTTLYVGSKEGKNRSYATDYLIRVVGEIYG